MTDDPTPTDDDLSLVLDGEADDELVARVEADPAARARLEQLRRTADALRSSSVPPLDGDVVDELIATAVDAPVAPTRPASAGRSRATPWLVAASVIVLMAVGLSLVWAGRGDDEDQAGATRRTTLASAETSSDAPEADATFGDASGAGASEAAPLGGHGAPTTIAPQDASRTMDLPVVLLGSFASGAELREATASSFTPSTTATGSSPADGEATGDQARDRAAPPSDAAVDRCAQQLQVTLSMEAPPTRVGYATVDGKDVLAYEFATTSARDGKPTTLVAAVGVEACDQVVIFER